MRTSSSDNSVSSAQADTANRKLSEKLKDITKIKFNIPTKFLNPMRNSADETNIKSGDQQAEQDETDQFHLEALDRTALRESDDLFQDCSLFMQSADHTLQLSQKVNSNRPLLVLSSSLNKWRAKGKGTKLYGQYEALLGRFDITEKQLKDFTDRSLNECASLMIQASHLRSRLTACVAFNSAAVDVIKPKVESARNHIAELEDYKKQVEMMLIFHDEVKKLKDNQVEPYIPWALRAAMNSTTPQIQCITFNRNLLEKRIANINQVVETVNRILQNDSKLFDKRMGDLSHCTRSLAAMENLLIKLQAYRTIISEVNDKRRSKEDAVIKENPIYAHMKKGSTVVNDEGDTEVTLEQTGQEDESDHHDDVLNESQIDEDQLPPVEFYNHVNCADCSCVISLGNDCVMNLAAIQHFAEDSTTRLHKLFSIREKVKEKARELENIEWGASN